MIDIAIYGGAFNPPTLGHLQVVSELLGKNIVQKIIICPDGKRDDKKYGISETARKKLIEIFVKNLQHKRYNIEADYHFFDDESGKYTTTYDVDQYFTEKLGFAPYHIFGTDVASGIANWNGNPSEYIEKKLNKLFVSRKGFVFPENSNLENFILTDVNSKEVSSSEVREKIKSRKKFENLIIPEIYRYIKKNNLYL